MCDPMDKNTGQEIFFVQDIKMPRMNGFMTAMMPCLLTGT